MCLENDNVTETLFGKQDCPGQVPNIAFPNTLFHIRNTLKNGGVFAPNDEGWLLAGSLVFVEKDGENTQAIP
jgi:hypothetical protein